MKHSKVTTLCVIGALGGFGCDSGDARSGGLPWDEGKVQVVGADGEVTSVALPRGDECLVVKPGEEFADADNCVKPQEQCQGAAAEVLVDAQGKVIETLCYPGGATVSVTELAENGGELPQNQNGAVIVLDSEPGVDFQGDILLDGNNVILYGGDPDNAVVDGSLVVEGNNTIVRGVRITGDVDVRKNNSVFFHCVIEGDLIIQANNTVLAGCDVYGKITVAGNNTKLVGNRFVQAPEITARNTYCEANVRAVDENENGVLEPDELGDPLDCP